MIHKHPRYAGVFDDNDLFTNWAERRKIEPAGEPTSPIPCPILLPSPLPFVRSTLMNAEGEEREREKENALCSTATLLKLA